MLYVCIYCVHDYRGVWKVVTVFHHANSKHLQCAQNMKLQIYACHGCSKCMFTRVLPTKYHVFKGF